MLGGISEKYAINKLLLYIYTHTHFVLFILDIHTTYLNANNTTSGHNWGRAQVERCGDGC